MYNSIRNKLKLYIKRVDRHSIMVTLVLLLLIVSGAYLITYRAHWGMEDDTIIQSKIGKGQMMRVNEWPVFTDEGRFFPMAYQHNNLLLLFHDAPIGADSVVILNAIIWGLFLCLLYWMCRISTKGRMLTTDSKWLSLFIVTIFVMRSIYIFCQLWTTLFIHFILIVTAILFLYYYFKTGKSVYLICMTIAVAYYSFCLETLIVAPLCIAVCAILGIYNAKRDWRIFIGMISVVVVFFLLYTTMILPNITTIYDSSHGTGVSMIENMVAMLLNQKLIILVLVTFFWRLYRVFLKKEAYDNFSDTLLVTSIGVIFACFIMKLNWPIYYVAPIVWAVPAMLRVFRLDTKRQRIFTVIFILMVFVYFAEKFPQQIQVIVQSRETIYEQFSRFDIYTKEESNIVWYQDGESDTRMTDNYAYVHACMHISQVKMIPNYRIMSIENALLDEFLLIMPSTNSETKMMDNTGITLESVEWEDHVQNLSIYKIKKK